MTPEPESYQAKLEREVVELKAFCTLMAENNKKLKKIKVEADQHISTLEQEIVKLKAQIVPRQALPIAHLRRTDIRTRHHPRR